MGLHNEVLPQYATYKVNSSLITRLLIRDGQNILSNVSTDLHQ